MIRFFFCALTALGIVSIFSVQGCGSGGNPDGGTGPGNCATTPCFRAYECVQVCGGPVKSSGCCPCGAGTFDRLMCATNDGGMDAGDSAADASMDADAATD